MVLVTQKNKFMVNEINDVIYLTLTFKGRVKCMDLKATNWCFKKFYKILTIQFKNVCSLVLVFYLSSLKNITF